MTRDKKLVVFLCVIFTLLNGKVQAKWADPPMELIGVPNVALPEKTKILIRENVGKDIGPFSIVKFNPDPPDATVELLDTDPRFIPTSIEDENGNKNWFLNLSTHFDYEALQFPSMQRMFAADGVDLFVTIEVEDENDNAPQFVRMVPEQVLPIPELQLKDDDDLVATIYAEDADKADTIFFMVEEYAKQSEHFMIKNETGELFLVKELNYDLNSIHRLNIILMDDREPFHRTPYGLTILVEDIPNNPPQFTRPPSIRSVKEELPLGEVITTVQARDGDYGLGWDIEYSIVDPLDLFSIDGVTGEVKVKNRIDAESPQLIDDLTHTITIIAKEKDHPEWPGLDPSVTTTEEEVTFSIDDIDDHAPLLCDEDNNNECNSGELHFSFSIDEDHYNIGDIPLDKTIRVTDADPTARFHTFTIGLAQNTDQIVKNAFTVSPSRGTQDATISISVLPQNGKWIDVENEELGGFWDTPKNITIEIVSTNNPSYKALAVITAEVNDINDNRPEFKFPEPGQTQYEFYVCENTEVDDGVLLKNVVVVDPNYPNSCPKQDPGDWEVIKVEAEDKDINPDFGQNSVRYRWSRSTRQPPVVIDSSAGTMTMNLTAGKFDYERFTTEIFMVEAVDSFGDEKGLSDSVSVTFHILDRNDEVVDLQLKSGSRASVKENTTMGADFFILDGITATDVDTTANIELKMEVNNVYSKKINGSSENQVISLYGDLEDKMKNWFDLKIDDDSTPGAVKARIVPGTELPDREGYSNGEVIVDRVDLTITATDWNGDKGPQITSQVVTIMIEDINDNPPRWVDDEETNPIELNVQETEEWGEDGDTESEYQREIHTFRATDPDTATVFKFELDNPDCDFGVDECKELKELFELAPNPNSRIGTAVLRRAHGKLIDREMPEINDHGDIIKLTVTVWDSETDPKNNLTSNIQIHVEDRNDNYPEFKEDYSAKEYFVDENGVDVKRIEQIIATDRDHPSRFGKVSYLQVDEDIEGDANNGMGKFSLHQDTGELANIPGMYEWFNISQFRIRVKAIDYYRPSSQTGSNFRYMFMLINVNDFNNHAPEFLTPQGGLDNPLVVINERETASNTPLPNGITIQDKDDPSKPNGQFSVKIESVSKYPPFPEDPELISLFKCEDLIEAGQRNEKSLMISPMRSLVGLWGNYTLTLTASDGANSDPQQMSNSSIYVIRIENENLNAPEFLTSSDNPLVEINESETDPSKPLPNSDIRIRDKDDPLKPNGQFAVDIDDISKEPEFSDDPADLKTLFKLGELEVIPGTRNEMKTEIFPRINLTGYWGTYTIKLKASDGIDSKPEQLTQYAEYVLKIENENFNAPEFLTPQGEDPLIVVNESEADPNEPFPNAIQIQDKDDPSKPNGDFSVVIESVSKDPQREDDPPDIAGLFRVGDLKEVGERNKKEFQIFPTRDLTGLWGTYTLTLKASDDPNSKPEQKTTSAKYIVKVENENLNAPVFIYPGDNSTYHYLSILDSRPGAQLEDIKDNSRNPVPNMYAEDRDKGSGDNGVVTYSLEASQNCENLFIINDVFGAENITGMITLRGALDETYANTVCQLSIKASDKGQDPQSSTSIVNFHLFVNKNTPPAFQVQDVEIPIFENSTGLDKFIQFPRAIDPDIEPGNPLLPGDEIHYLLKGGDRDLFYIAVEDCEEEAGRLCPGLKPKEMLDRDVPGGEMYKVSVYATNIANDGIEDRDPENIGPEDKQWIVVTINVIDVKDTAPRFQIEGVITGGFSSKSKTDEVVTTVIAIDPDIDDPFYFNISSVVEASDSSLPQIEEPFELKPMPDPNQIDRINIVLKFDPQDSFKGFYKFSLKVTDSVGMQSVTVCHMYMVANTNIVKIFFTNPLDEITAYREDIEQILTDVFSPRRCNIDRVVRDAANPNLTTVESHFINLERNIPVPREEIIEQQWTPEIYNNLLRRLSERNFNLAPNGLGGQDTPPDEDNSQLIMYILIGGIAVLGVSLLILGASCYYNNRSLSRRVRALTATTFGSQASDINRLGALDATPNTNAFAIEGSNPIWTVDGEKKKMPDFDVESVGSGGSVLIGAEDEDYFQKSTKNPMFQAEDVVANYDSDTNDIGAEREPSRRSYNDDNFQYGPSFANQDDRNYDYDDHDYETVDGNNTVNSSESPFATRTTRNPLMNLGGGTQMSVDVDALSDAQDDGFGFEHNTDVTLF